jgi:hypothetical protein
VRDVGKQENISRERQENNARSEGASGRWQVSRGKQIGITEPIERERKCRHRGQEIGGRRIGAAGAEPTKCSTKWATKFPPCPAPCRA